MLASADSVLLFCSSSSGFLFLWKHNRQSVFRSARLYAKKLGSFQLSVLDFFFKNKANRTALLPLLCPFLPKHPRLASAHRGFPYFSQWTTTTQQKLAIGVSGDEVETIVCFLRSAVLLESPAVRCRSPRLYSFNPVPKKVLQLSFSWQLFHATYIGLANCLGLSSRSRTFTSLYWTAGVVVQLKETRFFWELWFN